eukprot:TRINITY_DN37360_c0_g1_i1.p2 TRINITY_DN37360_c0_g1~~TRINITY_DN37360_c0_g1_i1.p2  ORF type:complete len:114 (-),score=35.18 TRINITY_DN37360_c0_g1_i1:11-352(-)
MAATGSDGNSQTQATAATTTEESGEALEQPGPWRRLRGALGRLGFHVVDNMSFVGEVLVDFLEIGKSEYHKEFEAIQKQRRKKEKMKKLQEEAEIAAIEDPCEASSPANTEGK